MVVDTRNCCCASSGRVNDVWIGSHVLIKSGVTISDGAVIGMGSVVTHDVGPYEIWAGNPARMIRKRFNDGTVENLKQIKWWNWNEEKIKEYAAYFSDSNEFISSYLVIQSFSYEDFLKKYTDCIMAIALFSIAVYFLYKVAPGAFGAFPRHLWRNHSVLFVNLWLSVVPVGMQDYFRNFGIFYEPGIFQFYLNIALLIELFSNKKINVFRVLVLTVAVITTLSTNGYISIVLVFFAYGFFVILGSGNRDKIYRKIGFLALLSVIAIIFVVLIDKGIIGSRVFMKFSSTKTSGSYYDRTNAISYALSKIFQNPLLGVAARGIEDSYNATFTPLNWMMLYGIVIEGYALVGYSKMFSRLASNRWLKIFVVAAAFSTILTQDLSFEWIVWCFIFCGIKNGVSKYNKKSELY